jgi:hypothetical protein
MERIRKPSINIALTVISAYMFVPETGNGCHEKYAVCIGMAFNWTTIIPTDRL